LIEIGLLTTLSDDRSNPMLNKLGHKVAAIAKMAKLAAKTPHGSRWEKLLSALTAVQAWSEQVDSQENRLREVTAFGSNPGELRMYSYVPEGLPARRRWSSCCTAARRARPRTTRAAAGRRWPIATVLRSCCRSRMEQQSAALLQLVQAGGQRARKG
jgi:hypothetical protein